MDERVRELYVDWLGGRRDWLRGLSFPMRVMLLKLLVDDVFYELVGDKVEEIFGDVDC